MEKQGDIYRSVSEYEIELSLERMGDTEVPSFSISTKNQIGLSRHHIGSWDFLEAPSATKNHMALLSSLMLLNLYLYIYLQCIYQFLLTNIGEIDPLTTWSKQAHSKSRFNHHVFAKTEGRASEKN
ncbi:hypothetical protein QQP08_007330 [Theobroma cacao]|nr:hypothetical protein QQP08_007330 [Theobroma cacao]